MTFPRLSLIFFLALAALLSACTEKGTTRPEVGKLSGRLLQADGRPAAFATVHLFPVDHVPQAGGLPKKSGQVEDGFVTLTDKDGRYRVDSLENGQYNILGKLEDSRSYQDSVPVSSTVDELPTGTLADPGSLVATLGMQPHHDPRTATVQVLGTNVHTNVEEDGQFTLGPLAAGIYRVRIATTEVGYTPRFVDLKFAEGQTDTLPSRLEIPFTGIPVVTGLDVIRYDTLAGIATVRWNRIRYAAHQKYAIFRDVAGALELSKVPLAFTTDTLWRDTVFRKSAEGPVDTSIRMLEYRVRVVNKSDVMGVGYGFVPLSAPSPARLRPRMDIGLSGTREEMASPRDTVEFFLEFENEYREITGVQWLVEPGMSVIRSAALSGRSGSDTLRLLTSDLPARLNVLAKVYDAAGAAWSHRKSLDVVLDAPRAQAGEDIRIWMLDSIRLRGEAFDFLGKVSLFEWDIGATGNFVRTGSGDTVLAPPRKPLNGLPCILRVTDDDGFIGLDTLRVFASSARIGKPLPTPMAFGSAAVVGGKLHVISRNAAAMYDPELDVWNPFNRFGDSSAALVALDSVLYAVEFSSHAIPGPGGWPLSGIKRTVARYNPSSDQWNSTSEVFRSFAGKPTLVAAEGRIYAIGGKSLWGNEYATSVDAYDPATGKWEEVGALPDATYGAAAACLNGKLYVFGGKSFGPDYVHGRSQVHILDLSARTWSLGRPLLNPLTEMSAVAFDGKIHLVGGGGHPKYTDWYGLTTYLQVYDPAGDAWSELQPYHSSNLGAAAALLGKEIVTVGGSAPSREVGTWTRDVDFYQLTLE